MTGWRRFLTGLTLITSLTMIVAACQIDGTAQPNAAAVASAQASSSAATRTTASPPPTTESTTPRISSSTIEDHSTSVGPSSTQGPSSTERSSTTASTTAGGPTVMMADDGFSVSIMVTTVWSRALVATGARVGIRTIEEPEDQIAALRSGQVDLVQQYNSGLLNFLDDNSDAVSQSAVDAAIAEKLPAGLSVLKSTPAKDDVQLTVSAATAAKYRLHSISDLAAHLADITLLLPGDTSAKSFSNGLANYYGLTFANTRTTDFAGPTTISAIRTTAAVGLMAASQYQIDDNKFVVLTDPEHMFLTENFIPLVGGKKITPAMRTTINAVSAKLSTSALRGMRKKVATGQGSFADVADAWLSSVGLR